MERKPRFWIPSPVGADFRVTDKGIYFITKPAEPGAHPTIRFYAFADGSTRLIATLEKPVCMGLSIAPDGRSLLYSQVEREDADLMLVEGFR